MSQYSNSEIISELQRVYKLLGKPFSRKEFQEHSEFSKTTIERRFGTWSNALKKAGLLDRFEKFRSVETEIEDFNPDEVIEDDWKKRKVVLKERAEQRKVQFLRDQMVKKDLLKEMLEETLAKADPPVVDVHPIRVVTRRKNLDKHCTLWFEFSDLQLGTLIKLEDMGGLNEHNWVVFKQKLEIWKNQAIEKIAEYSEQCIVDQILINCCGDMVEGQNIFKNQTWQVDRHVVDQAILGANDVAAAFIEIFLTFPDLKFFVTEVFGNHGRVGQKGEAPYSCSMDKVFQRMLELQVKATSEVENCTWHHNDAWFYLLDIYGWTHLTLHGDQGLGGLWSSRPTINALEKGLARYAGMLQQQINFCHMGHFHNSATMSLNMSQVLINGSFIGTSDFSAHTMVASSPPVQVMHVFDPRLGLVRTERIHLTSGEIKVPVKPNTLRK